MIKRSFIKLEELLQDLDQVEMVVTSEWLAEYIPEQLTTIRFIEVGLKEPVPFKCLLVFESYFYNVLPFSTEKSLEQAKSEALPWGNNLYESLPEKAILFFMEQIKKSMSNSI